MQARYPDQIVILVEGLVGPIESSDAERWMKARMERIREAVEVEVPAALVYQKLRSSGTLAKPRFFSVFETPNATRLLAELRNPYDHHALRPLGAASYALLDGLPRAARPQPDGGLMVGLTNCTDPADAAEFNGWYDRVHAADVIRSPWFWNTQRYRKLDGDLPDYAALYETTMGGSEALKQYMGWPERVSEMHPRIANLHVWSFDFMASL